MKNIAKWVDENRKLIGMLLILFGLGELSSLASLYFSGAFGVFNVADFLSALPFILIGILNTAVGLVFIALGISLWKSTKR